MYKNSIEIYRCIGVSSFRLLPVFIPYGIAILTFLPPLPSDLYGNVHLHILQNPFSAIIPFMRKKLSIDSPQRNSDIITFTLDPYRKPWSSKRAKWCSLTRHHFLWKKIIWIIQIEQYMATFCKGKTYHSASSAVQQHTVNIGRIGLLNTLFLDEATHGHPSKENATVDEEQNAIKGKEVSFKNEDQASES